MILKTSYFMLRRMLRGYTALAILMLIPLALITVLGLVARGAINPSGVPVMDTIAITMILAFQLYGGFYTMEYIKEDFLTNKKWRMISLPYPTHLYAFSIFLTCTLFSALQGFVMALFTKYVYDVNWGNLGLVLLVLMVISLFTQLVYFIIIMLVKNYKIAEGLGTTYALISMGLAGVWFPMPEIKFIRVLSTYGNPLSLGQNAVYTFITGENVTRALVSISILIIASVILAFIAAFVGRRKLA